MHKGGLAEVRARIFHTRKKYNQCPSTYHQDTKSSSNHKPDISRLLTNQNRSLDAFILIKTGPSTHVPPVVVYVTAESARDPRGSHMSSPSFSSRGAPVPAERRPRPLPQPRRAPLPRRRDLLHHVHRRPLVETVAATTAWARSKSRTRLDRLQHRHSTSATTTAETTSVTNAMGALLDELAPPSAHACTAGRRSARSRGTSCRRTCRTSSSLFPPFPSSSLSLSLSHSVFSSCRPAGGSGGGRRGEQGEGKVRRLATGDAGAGRRAGWGGDWRSRGRRRGAVE